MSEHQFLGDFELNKRNSLHGLRKSAARTKQEVKDIRKEQIVCYRMDRFGAGGACLYLLFRGACLPYQGCFKRKLGLLLLAKRHNLRDPQPS